MSVKMPHEFTATLYATDPALGGFELRRLAEELASHLQSVPETNRIEVIGGQPRELVASLQPIVMAGRLTSLDDVLMAINRSHVRTLSGGVDLAGERILLELDARVDSAQALEALVVNVVDGVPVRLATRVFEGTGRLARLGVAKGTSEGPGMESLTVLALPDASIAAPIFSADLVSFRGRFAVAFLDMSPFREHEWDPSDALLSARSALMDHCKPREAPDWSEGLFSKQAVLASAAVDIGLPLLEAAKAYADKQGIDYHVVPGPERTLKIQAYADNFR